jgi:hypothetical protein
MSYLHYWDYKYINKLLGEKPKEKEKDGDI